MPTQDGVEFIPLHFSEKGEDPTKHTKYFLFCEGIYLEINFLQRNGWRELSLLGTRVTETGGVIEIKRNDYGRHPIKEEFEMLNERIRHTALNRLEGPAKDLLAYSLR